MQAAITATHAGPLTPDALDWSLILDLYDQLATLNASPVVALNRAVAVSKVHGPAEALAAIEPLACDRSLRRYHLWLAVRGHLLLDLGRHPEAAECFRLAAAGSCSEPERRFLARKLAECGVAG